MSEHLPTEESTFFHGVCCFRTSPEVWAVLHARHKDQLRVFGSYSAPHEGCMETTYCLRGADYPLIGARTTWQRGKEEYERVNEKHEYFLFVIEKEIDDE